MEILAKIPNFIYAHLLNYTQIQLEVSELRCTVQQCKKERCMPCRQNKAAAHGNFALLLLEHMPTRLDIIATSSSKEILKMSSYFMFLPRKDSARTAPVLTLAIPEVEVK